MERRSIGGGAAGRFGPELVAGFAARFPPEARFVVAFSGGADSLALLHAFARTEVHGGARLRAVHVDHRLHAESGRWARQCMEVCRRLAVELTVIDAGARANAGGRGDEEAARAARYEAFERILSPGDVLCTAHSEDDHAETVLLNLLRGAGPRGLAGIPETRPLGAGTVARPVRGVSRAALRAYACGTGLPLVRDPANEDRRFARAVLRRDVMPLIETRWPAARSALARAAALGRESADLLDALAAIDLEPAGGVHADRLDAAAVAALEPARRRNAVACWLRTRGIAAPGARRIERIVREVIGAGPDAMPCVRLGDVEIRRYRGQVRLVTRDHTEVPETALRWTIPETLTFGHGRLAWAFCRDGGLDDAIRDAEIMVRFRGGQGARTREGWKPGEGRHGRAAGAGAAAGRARSLRKRFQEIGIPPWERGRIPLIYVDGRLAAIGSGWISPRLAAAPEAPGWRIVWTPRSGIAHDGSGRPDG